MAPLIPTSSTDNSHLKWGVDERTDFVPSQAPLARLPPAWEAWETRLDSAVRMKLQLAERVEMIPERERLKEESKSRSWRRSVAKMPLLPIEELQASERLLRRAHHVLTCMLQFYGQTVPSTEQITIPRSLAVPLLQVSKYLQVPPVITYFDVTIFNWRSIQPLPDGSLLSVHGLQALTTFTSTPDEEEFHLLSTRIELRGGEALELLRLATERAFESDDDAIDQAAQYLERAAAVIQDLREIMLSVKGRIDPEIFYNEIRAWLKGADSDPWGRSWVLEGSEEVKKWPERSEVSGVTAGQSPLIRALDTYLGVKDDRGQSSYSAQPGKKSFQERMVSYMTFSHRSFLQHLRERPRQLRARVQEFSNTKGIDSSLVQAYNRALRALKDFRDAHMIVVTLLVVGPARRATKKATEAEHITSGPSMTAASLVLERKKDEKLMQHAFDGGDDKGGLKGTGGTDLVKFLKGVRDQTSRAYLQE